jgi:hypothetical protein
MKIFLAVPFVACFVVALANPIGTECNEPLPEPTIGEGFQCDTTAKSPSLADVRKAASYLSPNEIVEEIVKEVSYEFTRVEPNGAPRICEHKDDHMDSTTVLFRERKVILL